VDKWLKWGLKLKILSKRRGKTFPWKSTYSLTNQAKIIKAYGGWVLSFDRRYRLLIEYAGEHAMPPRKIVDHAIDGRKSAWRLFFDMTPAWRGGTVVRGRRTFAFIRDHFSAVNAIIFWGMYYIFSFPHIIKEAETAMLENGLVAPSEEKILKKVLAIR
jgi:hypothetical protein